MVGVLTVSFLDKDIRRLGSLKGHGKSLTAQDLCLVLPASRSIYPKEMLYSLTIGATLSLHLHLPFGLVFPVAPSETHFRNTHL